MPALIAPSAAGRSRSTAPGRGPRACLGAVALAVGTAGLALGLGAAALAVTQSAQQEHRSEALSARAAETPAQVRLLVSDHLITVRGHPVSVVSVWPVRPDASPPPGVDRWPGPGQAVLSPALRDDLRDRPDLFGKPVGTITAEGLEVPRERRVYRRPAEVPGPAADLRPSSGFTGSGPVVAGGSGAGTLYARPTRHVLWAVLATLILPALAALITGAAMDDGTRRRTVPLVTGALAGALPLAVLCLRDVELPFLDAVLPARDARAAWRGLVAGALAAPALGALAVLALRWRRPGLSADPPQDPASSGPGRSLPTRRAGVCAAAALMTIWLPGSLVDPGAVFVAYLVGVAVVAGTVPAVLGVTLAVVGAALEYWGTRFGRGGSLAAGRRLQACPRRTASLAGTASVAVLLLGQVQLWATMVGPQYLAAEASHAALGERVLQVSYSALGRGSGRDVPGLDSFVASLPPGVGTVWVGVPGPDLPGQDDGVTISGDCPALMALALPCPAVAQELTRASRGAPVEHLLRWTAGDDAPVRIVTLPRPAPPTDPDATLLLVSTTGEDLPVTALQQAFLQRVDELATLAPLGHSWTLTPRVHEAGGRWVVLLGLLGMLGLLTALSSALAADVSGAGSRGSLLVQAFWCILAPLTLATVAGSFCYLALPVANALLRPSAALALGAVAVAVAVGASFSVSVGVDGAGVRPHPGEAR